MIDTGGNAIDKAADCATAAPGASAIIPRTAKPLRTSRPPTGPHNAPSPRDCLWRTFPIFARIVPDLRAAEGPQRNRGNRP